MKDNLDLSPEHDGDLWLHKNRSRMSHPHRHDELELNIILGGTASYLVGNNRVNLVPNSLFWLFPEQDHILIDESSDYVMWCLVFKSALLQRACLEGSAHVLLDTNPAGIYCRRISQSLLGWLTNLCEQVWKAKSESLRFNYGLGYLLLSAWSTYEKANDPILVEGIHPSVAQAVHLILAGEDDGTLPGLAAQVSISPSRLSRLFNSQTGMSVTDFRNRHRINRFITFYEPEQNKTMLDISLAAGFGSYAQFHRTFKQIIGVSPHVYYKK